MGSNKKLTTGNDKKRKQGQLEKEREGDDVSRDINRSKHMFVQSRYGTSKIVFEVDLISD